MDTLFDVAVIGAGPGDTLLQLGRRNLDCGQCVSTILKMPQVKLVLVALV